MYSGETLSLSRRADGIVTLTFDRQGSAVNLFDPSTVDELSKALDALEAEHDIAGLLVCSKKQEFLVGADIHEMPALFKQPPEAIRAALALNNRNFRRLERLPYPVVVAINGLALGGGLELCLACDVRVASRSAAVGLPETGLGIIPGWGGTVRLPRVAGGPTALEWISSARQQGIDAALQAKVVDAAVSPEELRAVAEGHLEDCIRGRIDWSRLRSAKERTDEAIVAEAARLGEQWQARLAQKFGVHYPAPAIALKTMLHGLDRPLDEALAIEAQGFAEAAKTFQARALVGNFLSGQYLKKLAADRARQVSQPVARAAVLGAGIMGGGIAYQSALTGTPILMKDIAQAGLDLGLKEADKLLSKRVRTGQLTAETKARILGSITPTLEYGPGFKDVDVLVEAVVENLRVKHAVLAEAERQVGAATILCSNTSTLPISELATALQRPQQFCGMHFFNPVHAMPLVEIIRGRQTSEDTINRAVAYALALKKQPVVVNDCPGFLVNRLLFAYFAGFLRLLHDGADYEHVDRVMEQWGWPMGPALLADVVGLDTMQHCDDVLSAAYAGRLQKDFKSWYQVIMDLGGLGQKNGRGFYLHSLAEGRPVKTPNPETQARIAALAKPARAFPDEEIVERIMAGMGIELAQALEEGIVASPQEADIALLYGVGFPAFRGGLARWMDTVGAEAFCSMADRYVAELGPLYRVTERQRDMARRAATFYA